ncbi:MAG: nucleoside hydrolase [Proteobacteria bacterium]|nr:nucleoside hydrolase [Pseudomonadota bacterium]
MAVKTPVIFDTDPGIDDAMALIFLNACQRLELKGLTTVFGNASLAQCTNNALYLCERFGIDVPVHAGADATIMGVPEDHFPVFVHGADGLANINAAPQSRQQAIEPAADFLIESAVKYSKELVIIAVGRMTNIAIAIQANGEFASNVKEIILMGGAVNVPGNVTQWAEANIFGDAEAANILFASGIPVTQVGLDVTMKTIMSEQYIQDLANRCGDAGHLLSQITPYYLNFYLGKTGVSGFACHDSSAVAHAEDPEIHQMKTGTVSVVLEGDQRGRTVFTEQENNQGLHSVCIGVDAPKLLETYDDYLVRAYG